MTTAESHPGTGWLVKLPGRLLRALKSLVLALVLAWAALAIYYAPLP